jgi:hypothetical protein
MPGHSLKLPAALGSVLRELKFEMVELVMDLSRRTNDSTVCLEAWPKPISFGRSEGWSSGSGSVCHGRGPQMEMGACPARVQRINRSEIRSAIKIRSSSEDLATQTGAKGVA